ncbi:Rieske (2Fe-2S) protein [Roseisolibacter sp. H3M3-2]|uniref:Rieske (2Fe-2S) protein n=1 Tax=Roseisolibacter sp. H3M3-2 TaxID=3031323 RepID=UPI0023DBABEE|nr:Rieske (2Fe-2S) protein [Roseisolibacter sp. H3M3-2]MDF1501714.1 Rieske (2Fe-2S) protein [Roseisolibacter sp. H3M3-2]
MRPLPTLPDASVSRRDFVAATTCSLVAAALAACGGGGDGGPTDPGGPAIPADGGATIAGGVLTVQLARFAALTQANGFQVFGTVGGQRADVVVINTAAGYRAFSSICTHEQCTVGTFTGSRIVCPCHGSQYDTSGAVVVGPATRALAQYAVSLNAAAGTLTVTKG